MKALILVCILLATATESEEALNQWLARYPELKDKPYGSVEQALEEIKKRQK